MSENHEHEGFGVIQLGAVTSYGRWKKLAGHLELSFDMRSLSLDRQRDLESYRHSSLPLPVQIPCDRRKFQCVVIGFQRSERNAKFYIAPPANKKGPQDEDDGGAKPPE